MENLVSDLSTLTTIPKESLLELSQKILYCISDAVNESVCDNEEVTEIKTSLGSLYIKHTETEVKYRFVPSDLLATTVNKAIHEKLNLLEDSAKSSLVSKIENTYKDLL